MAYVVHLELRLQALAQGATACASPPGKATPLPDELELALTPCRREGVWGRVESKVALWAVGIVEDSSRLEAWSNV